MTAVSVVLRLHLQTSAHVDSAHRLNAVYERTTVARVMGVGKLIDSRYGVGSDYKHRGTALTLRLGSGAFAALSRTFRKWGGPVPAP